MVTKQVSQTKTGSSAMEKTGRLSENVGSWKHQKRAGNKGETENRNIQKCLKIAGQCRWKEWRIIKKHPSIHV